MILEIMKSSKPEEDHSVGKIFVGEEKSQYLIDQDRLGCNEVLNEIKNICPELYKKAETKLAKENIDKVRKWWG